jgi:hypothetical protein
VTDRLKSVAVGGCLTHSPTVSVDRSGGLEMANLTHHHVSTVRVTFRLRQLCREVRPPAGAAPGEFVGLTVTLLLRPSRRSSSATRAVNRSIVAACSSIVRAWSCRRPRRR